jgi:hypothetical protein
MIERLGLFLMKSYAAIVAVVLSSLLAACADNGSRDTGSCADAIERPAEVITELQLEEVSGSASNVGLDVTSNLKEPVRLTVRFNGTLAIDVEIHGTPAECSHPPSTAIITG